MSSSQRERGVTAPTSATTPGRRAAILVVEDDLGLAAETCEELRGLGYSLTHTADGAEALDIVRSTHFDLLIVDRMLPGMEGLRLIETLRAENIRTPVLVLSALGELDDRVRGLKAGGDDYLTKPVALVELDARVEALLRRPTDTRETVLRVGPLVVDLIDRTVFRGERELDLLPREFRLLEYLVRRPGQIVTRDMLLEDVWNYRFLPQTNLVDVHIGRLRRKLDEPGETPLISSVRGAGFVFRVPD
jgi:two-component system OmpR family response regulator